MCGIAGAVWNDANKAVEQATLQRMIDVLRHRGPDGEGTYVADAAQRRPAWPWAIGGWRSSTSPAANSRCRTKTARCGSSSTAKSTTSASCAAGWKAPGHRFRTQSDTEVLVHLYEDEGPEFLTHLNGMFALALWDARRRQLLLARDRLGKKPLVYRHEPGRLLFASELKALLQVPGVPREIDPQALDEYLTYQYVPHPRTIFRGIAKLPPGHYALYRDGRLDVRPYWQPDFNAEDDRPAEEYARELRTLLTSSVEMRLQSEVPLGAFLSGGIDSTIVVGLMSQLAGEPVRTFSIGFPVQGVRRDALRPGGGRAVRHDPRGVPGAARRDGGPAPAGVALRRAVCRQFGRADVVRFATDPAARHRGADRRRRRRAVRRLSALSGRLAGRGVRPFAARSCGGCCAAAIGRGCRPARGRSRSLRRWKRFVEMLSQPPARAVSGMDRHFRPGPARGAV